METHSPHRRRQRHMIYEDLEILRLQGAGITLLLRTLLHSVMSQERVLRVGLSPCNPEGAPCSIMHTPSTR